MKTLNATPKTTWYSFHDFMILRNAKFKVPTHFEVFTQLNTKYDSRFSQGTFDCCCTLFKNLAK